MALLFWFTLILVFFIYFGYPFAIFLIAGFKGKRPVKENITPVISLVIPVYNEEAVIRDKIENSLSLDYPEEKLEIVFALDGCTDRTGDILKEYACRGIKFIDKKDREGKVQTLNKVLPCLKGEIIVFSDANSIYKTDALKKIAGCFSDPAVGCVCGRLVYRKTDFTSLGKGENLYWKYETFLKKQESRLGRLLVTNGSIQAVIKNIYPCPNPDVADDFSIPILIQSKGYKVLYEPEAVAYETATQSLKEEFDQKLRIVAQGFKGVVCLRRDILRLGWLGCFELLFHKLLRWKVPFFMVFLFVSNICLLDRGYVYRVFFAGQLLFYFLALTGFLLRHRQKIKIFYIPFYFCLVNFASLAAFFTFLKKGETRVWDKAGTTRAT